MSFQDRYESIIDNTEASNRFVSTSLRMGGRAFSLLNTNTRSIVNYEQYARDLYINEIESSTHQIIPRLKELNVHERTELDRREVLLHFNSSEYNKYLIELTTLLLSLNSNFRIWEEFDRIDVILTADIRRNYRNLLQNIIENRSIENRLLNSLFDVFLLLGNDSLLYYFLDNVNERETIKTFIQEQNEIEGSLINKRRKDVTPSTFVDEAKLYAYYRSIQNLVIPEEVNVSEALEAIEDEFSQLFNDIDPLGAPTADEWGRYREEIQGMEDLSIIELMRTLGYEQIENNIFRRESGDAHNVVENVSTDRGYDRESSTTVRVGQKKFRDLLCAETQHLGCRVSGCSVMDSSHLIASHIKSWKESNEEEKVDFNNGLLLCPNHDHLFDRHLITFSADGLIRIASRLAEIEYESFGINTNTRIEMSEENRDYMLHHNRFFERKDI